MSRCSSKSLSLLQPSPSGRGAPESRPSNKAFPIHEQAVAFLVGYLLQDIKLAVWIALGGTALTFVAVIPAWPWYNKHPLKWLPLGGETSHISVPQSLIIDEKSLR